MFTEGRDDFFHGRDQLVAVAEVVEHDDAAARLAHADHFVHDFTVVRHGSHDVSGHHGVERVVGKVHLSCIHQHQPHMIKVVVRLALTGLGQHAGGKVDTDDLAVLRIVLQGNARSHPDFQDLLLGSNAQITHGRFARLVK